MTCVSGIYKIAHGASGRLYVGSAVNLKKRWVDHRSALRGNRHHNRQLQRAWNKYGEQSFEFLIIEIVASGSDLLAREQHWIDALGAAADLYNTCPTAGNSLHMKHSGTSLRRMSEVQSGKTISLETRAKMSAAHSGKIKSPETRERMSTWQRGRELSAETKEKIRKINLGRKHTDAATQKMSLVARGDKNPKAKLNERMVVAIRRDQRSIKEIALEYSVSSSNICSIKSRKTWGWVE